MKQYVQKVYEMLYSPILTPWNLVDNIKLDNYKYVNFSRRDNMVICEMLCEVDNKEVTFNYLFTMDDKLMKITMLNGLEITTLFDRNSEITTIKSKILKQSKTA